MKRLAACIACFWVAAAFAAPDPQRLEEARALMRSLQIERNLDAMVGAMSAGMARQMTAVTGRDPRAARIAMEESMAMARERATRPGGLLDTMTEVYAEEFTVDELRQIRAFHESPIGRKMLDTTPRLMQKVMERSALTSKDMVNQACARVKARMQAENVPGGDAMKCGEPAK